MTSEQKKENDARFERIMAHKRRDPIGFALMRIAVAWDELNAVYMKSGITEDFKAKRDSLRLLIRANEMLIGNDRLRKFRLEHPDYINKANGKVIHGYNFAY